MSGAPSPPFGWLGIIRLGLVQTSLGAIVILMTSTLNRVMVVELGLAAAIPGLLVGWHYAVQMSRPRWGYGADAGGRRAPWILGGVAVLAAGAISARYATHAAASAGYWRCHRHAAKDATDHKQQGERQRQHQRLRGGPKVQAECETECQGHPL